MDQEINYSINNNSKLFPLNNFNNLFIEQSISKNISVLIIDAGLASDNNVSLNDFNNKLNEILLNEITKLKLNSDIGPHPRTKGDTLTSGVIVGFRYSDDNHLYLIEKIISLNLINIDILKRELTNIIYKLEPINPLISPKRSSIFSILMDLLTLYDWIPSNKSFNIVHIKTYNID